MTKKNKTQTTETCYLCGNSISHNTSIDSEKRTRDHVPAQNIYPHDTRTIPGMEDLLVLPTHQKCNNSYKLDEQYFRNCMGIGAMDTTFGQFLARDILTPKNLGSRLLLKIYKEFEPNPSGLHLPGLVKQNFDRKRIGRVIWKIVRGLFFNHKCEILPESKDFGWELLREDELPNSKKFIHGFKGIRRNRLGIDGNIFDYRFTSIHENGIDWELWGLNFWTHHVFFVWFHSPSCSCKACNLPK